MGKSRMGWGLGTEETAREVPQGGSRDQSFSSSIGHTSHQGSLGDDGGVAGLV